MKQGLTLRAAQHLTLTPQLQQSIRLLQLSSLELNQEILVQLDKNPFLELLPASDEQDANAPLSNLSEAAADEEGGEFSDLGDGLVFSPDGFEYRDAVDFEHASKWNDQSTETIGEAGLSLGRLTDLFGTSPRVLNGNDGEDDWMQCVGSHLTLRDHLQAQAIGLRCSVIHQAALHYLIDSLDDDGWLMSSLEALVHDFINHCSMTVQCPQRPMTYEEALVFLEQGLEFLQDMEPVGVGARTLQECLQLQLLGRLGERRAVDTRTDEDADCDRVKTIAVALQVLRQPLALLARRDVRQLAKLCTQSEVAIRRACDLIRRLEPRPGRAFSASSAVECIPDVVVRWGSGQYEAVLAPHTRPGVSVNSHMVQAIKSTRLSSRDPMQGALREAQWFVKSLGQRCDTILRVSRSIVARQQAFFAHGPLHLKPLVLREVADELGLHESTVSRVTTEKYMTTPQGTFEFKYFFSSALHASDGQITSSTAVRALIAQWVMDEDPKQPLSDKKLSEMLASHGIDCARRTVAKYREVLKIAPTNLRRIF